MPTSRGLGLSAVALSSIRPSSGVRRARCQRPASAFRCGKPAAPRRLTRHAAWTPTIRTRLRLSAPPARTGPLGSVPRPSDLPQHLVELVRGLGVPRGKLLEARLHPLELVLAQVLEVEQPVTRLRVGPDQLVELELDRLGI